MIYLKDLQSLVAELSLQLLDVTLVDEQEPSRDASEEELSCDLHNRIQCC